MWLSGIAANPISVRFPNQKIRLAPSFGSCRNTLNDGYFERRMAENSPQKSNGDSDDARTTRWPVLLAAIGCCGHDLTLIIAPFLATCERANRRRRRTIRTAGDCTAAPRGPRIEGGQVNGHWREGTRLIDQPGQFKIAGDRLGFTSSDGTLHFDCLENLCGQRIARTVTDSPEALFWSVTGELTEYRGTNFLLLTQAVLKPRSPRSATAP